MTYEVHIIGEWDLPRRQDWALVRDRGHTVLLVKEGAFTVELLAEVWAGGRKLNRRGELPAPRVPLQIAR